jgi:hypothetical protein
MAEQTDFPRRRIMNTTKGWYWGSAAVVIAALLAS